MKYRILTNGRDFKIQRKGRGPVITKKFLEYGWKYEVKDIDKWEDMRGCDLYEKSADTVFYGNQGDPDKERSIKLFANHSSATEAMINRIKEDDYLENKDKWNIVKDSSASKLYKLFLN